MKDPTCNKNKSRSYSNWTSNFKNNIPLIQRKEISIVACINQMGANHKQQKCSEEMKKNCCLWIWFKWDRPWRIDDSHWWLLGLWRHFSQGKNKLKIWFRKKIWHIQTLQLLAKEWGRGRPASYYGFLHFPGKGDALRNLKNFGNNIYLTVAGKLNMQL